MKQRTRKKQLAPAQALPFSSKSKPNLHRSPPRVNSEDPSPPAPDINPPGTRSSAPSPLSDSTLSDSSARESCSPESDTPDELEPPVPQEWVIPEMELVPFQESPKPHQRASMSTFSVLPSLRLLSIPRPLRTPLSFLDPEHFQVSDTTSSELDLGLYASPSLECLAETSQELTSFVQPPCCATAIEVVWNLSPSSQARCYSEWRPLEHCRPSILCPRFGRARDVFLCRYRPLACNGPAARETLSAGF